MRNDLSTLTALHDPDELSDYAGARVKVPDSLSAYRGLPKRLLDVGLTLLLAPAALIVILVLALLISLDGGRPFYSQQRVGRHGREFRLWKLRSMCPNAERVLDEHLLADPRARIEWEATQKLKRDPRVTRLGRIIRKTSLDELPQLWNVLIGNMSLVGPRPMMPEQRALYPGKSYFELRPGITGNWQVSARNEARFADRAEFDDVYYREVSLKTDVKLMLATFRVVVSGTGN